MAAYNSERYLQQAIDSILSQTFHDFELIVVNDGSTDRTADILSSYSDPRLITLTNQVNIGIPRSANKGISTAKGDLIARHDSDDISHPDRFRHQVEFLEANPTIGLVSTNFDWIDHQGRVLDTEILPTTNDELKKCLEEKNIFAQGSVMMRREIFMQAGWYRDFFPVTSDYDLWLRIAELTELANIPKSLFQVRIHGESISRKKHSLQMAYKQLACSLALQRRSGEEEGPIPEDVLQAYPPDPYELFLNSRRTAFLYFKDGQLAQAEKCLEEAEQHELPHEEAKKMWFEWGLSQAHQLAEQTGKVEEGEGFIKWALKIVDLDNLRRPLLGHYYADQAFIAYQNRSGRKAFLFACQAALHDKRWLRNRGLWVTGMKSLLGV